MNDLKEKFNLIRAGGGVRRFHTWPIAPGTEASVAAHSWGAAMIVDLIYGGAPPVDVLRAALLHDVYEARTGDIPATTKWANPAVEEAFRLLEQDMARSTGTLVSLSATERFILHCADKMDGLAFCNEQIRLGNANMIIVFYRWWNKLHKEFNDKFDVFSWEKERSNIIDICDILISEFFLSTRPFAWALNEAELAEGAISCLRRN